MTESTPADANREAWLIKAAEAMTPWLREVVDADHPEIRFRLSVGWPGGRANKKVTRGQCWASSTAEDGIAQIFISPAQRDTVTTLAVLLHEMVHAYDDCKDSHKGRFIKFARPLGFTAKWTSSDNRQEHLTKRLQALAEVLGEFPSAALVDRSAGGVDGPKPQKNRQLKAECENGTGYKVRLSQKWIDEFGAPICACCQAEMMIEEKP
jgi:hypothetical protein